MSSRLTNRSNLIESRVELDMSPADGLRQAGIRKAVRIGLNRASSPVKAAVVSHAQAVRKFGFTAKSIRIRLRLYPADRFVSVVGPTMNYVRTTKAYTRGPKKGEKRRHRPAYYAHLIEKGTKRSKAHPFLAPAHAETAARFLDQVGTEVGREIDKELARRAAR